MRTFSILLAASLSLAAPASAASADDLKRVIDDYWAWVMRNNPVWATTLGARDHDDRIRDNSLAQADREAKDAQGFLDRLKTIPDAALSSADRVNKGVLENGLKEAIAFNGFGQRMMLFTTYDGWHQSFANMADGLPFRGKRDYESYLARIAQYPKLNREAIAISRQAVKGGYLQPCLAMNGFENTITGVIADDPAKSRFYAPFLNTKPLDTTDAEWAAMQARAKTIITGTLHPEYRAFHDFYMREYKPKCAKSIAASDQPGGKAYYAAVARSHTTTSLTPDEIHQIGLSEVARIKARMVDVASKAGFATREAFIADLRTNPKYYAKTPEELMEAVARQTKIIDGQMPKYFGRLPRLPYGLKEIPRETAETTTSAFYSPGSVASGIAGFYYVNTSKLTQRPLYELPALSAHEAVPGHHHQGALQQEIDLPDFRKHGVWYTAFGEGWALYTEYLGEEMGLYDTPEKMMGRLSMEMWRACRLVVDTGMHTKGWTKAQAVAFMKDNTALSEANIEAEVNRYISWPGQALGYKMGEIKIRELRAKAQSALGPKFDIRRFHDAVLLQGPVPLDVLARQIDEWIASEKARS